MFARVKARYKLKELGVGGGKIFTPHFEYTAYATQDDQDPGKACLVEELSGIDPQVIQEDWFNEIVASRFNQLIFEFE